MMEISSKVYEIQSLILMVDSPMFHWHNSDQAVSLQHPIADVVKNSEVQHLEPHTSDV